MRLITKYFLAVLLMLPAMGSFAQFTNSKTKTISAKEKTEVSSTRKKDLQRYSNLLTAIENAIESRNISNIIETAKFIEKLSSREIARSENDLIDLYTTKEQSEQTKNLTSTITERLRLEKKSYKIITETDFTINEDIKQAMYAHRSMNLFKTYMQENYNDIDKPKENKPNNTNGLIKDVEKTPSTTKGGMMTASGNKNTKVINRAINEYYKDKDKKMATLSKFSREIVIANSKKDYYKVNSSIVGAKHILKKIITIDNEMLTKINAGEFKDLKLSGQKLSATLNSENNLLREYEKIKIPRDGKLASSLLTDFIRLPRKL